MMQEVEVLKTIPELVCSYFSEEQFTLSVRRLLLQLRSKSWYNFKYMDFSTGKIDGMKQSTGGSCEDISGDRRGVD